MEEDEEYEEIETEIIICDCCEKHIEKTWFMGEDETKFFCCEECLNKENEKS